MKQAIEAHGESIVDFLRRMNVKARASRGGDGCRTTREVADYFGVPLARARRHLHALWDADEIEAFDGGASGEQGNPILWRAKG